MSKIIEKDVRIHCNDKILPPTEEIRRERPSQAFLDSIEVIQMHRIGLRKKGNGHLLLWGRKRLLAIRILHEEEKHDGYIDAVILTGGTEDMYNEMIAQENNLRSDNPYTLYESLRYYLQKDNKATYKSIAPLLGTTAGTLKALDNQFSQVPSWAIDAAIEGNTSKSALTTLSKLSKEQKVEAYKIYKKEGKLTTPALKEMKQAAQAEMHAQLMPSLGLDTTQPRSYFNREELQTLVDLIPSSAKEAKKYGKQLLAEKE